jgi:hypothetical protein
MITGMIVGAVAGGVQPARSSGTAGAVGQAAEPEAAGEPAALGDPGELAAGPPPDEQAAAVNARQVTSAASARDPGRDGEDMPKAYPPNAVDGVAREARIRRRNPEDP